MIGVVLSERHLKIDGKNLEENCLLLISKLRSSLISSRDFVPVAKFLDNNSNNIFLNKDYKLQHIRKLFAKCKKILITFVIHA